MRGRGGPYLSDNSVPQQVQREDLGDMGQTISCMETVFKLIDVRERGGTILVRQKWSPQQVRREETCRQIILETVFKVDVRERGNKSDPSSISGERRQTDHLGNSF